MMVRVGNEVSNFILIVSKASVCDVFFFDCQLVLVMVVSHLFVIFLAHELWDLMVK
jgi:hypothetical protein